MRLSSPEARRICLTVGFLVKDGAKGSHIQNRGRSCLNTAGKTPQAWGHLWSFSVLQYSSTCFKMQLLLAFSLSGGR